MKPTRTAESSSLWDQVDWAALGRLRARFLDESGAGDDYWAGEVELRSYDLTFGQRIAWKWLHVLGELESLGWTPPAAEVVDWGCGSGVAGRVFANAYHGRGVKGLSLWDRSTLAMRYARGRAAERFPDLPVSPWMPDAEERPFVLLFSHVLTELDPAGMEKALALARKAEAVVCVEPGAFGASRRLIHVREALRSEFRVVAPCTHASPCGMLTPGNESHWCHHFAWPPPEVFTDPGWSRFASFMGIDLRGLPVSYLVLDRRREPSVLEGAVRCIGHARVHKPHALVLGCDASGVSEKKISRRFHPGWYKRLRKDEVVPWVRWICDGDDVTELAPAVGEVVEDGDGTES